MPCLIRAPPLLLQATDAATDMLYLHLLSPAVVHRNLKPTNLLVASDWSVVVADFALTHVLKAAAPASAGSHHAWQVCELLCLVREKKRTLCCF